MSFKSEFKLQNLKFSHDNIDDFYTLKCCGIPYIGLWVIRFIFTLYSVGSLIFSIAFYNKSSWPVFLTNWGLVLCVVYFVTVTTLSGIHYFGNGQPTTGTPLQTVIDGKVQESSNFPENIVIPTKVKFLWLVYNLSYNAITALIILYWALVHTDDDFGTDLLIYSYLNDHGILYLLMLIDFSFSSIPVRILHVVYTLVLALLYLIVAVAYNFAEKPVYPVLDWKEKAGLSTGYFIGALILIVIVQFVMYGCDRLRGKLRK